jgi:hypothetical protein
MPGCFGLLSDPHPSHVPPERFTQSHPCADVFELYREGLLFEGAAAIVQTPHGGYRTSAQTTGKIFIDDQPVVIGTHPALAQKVFLCPGCGQARYKLFCVGPVGLLSLPPTTHASRHKFRSIPHRLMLRRKIGADPTPFTPIAPRPLQQRRYWRIVREIRQLEAGLVQHARSDVFDVLERRHDRSQRHRAGDR